MNWITLTTAGQLAHVDERSRSKIVLLFKHSTRCSISVLAKNRLEGKWKDADHDSIEPYYLDLLSFRPVSNLIESHYKIPHASPQVLMICNGECIYSASHTDITYEEVMEAAQKKKKSEHLVCFKTALLYKSDCLRIISAITE